VLTHLRKQIYNYRKIVGLLSVLIVFVSVSTQQKRKIRNETHKKLIDTIRQI